ncbi:hypothetical protein HanRHA438_Chr02g0084061 [Helianthus annuus]|nr:hypothetical protein HanIR_Chr02g0085081 [Helianthus annuus]KAJ0940495.1 hypothetical protein HanRHA438_Chr02g0084061 [Helianthus annuus]KAJ0952262.1 hypothetical protein HanPSC8_Chr02g0070151 [Helianthus annuus]
MQFLQLLKAVKITKGVQTLAATYAHQSLSLVYLLTANNSHIKTFIFSNLLHTFIPSKPSADHTSSSSSLRHYTQSAPVNRPAVGSLAGPTCPHTPSFLRLTDETTGHRHQCLVAAW